MVLQQDYVTLTFWRRGPAGFPGGSHLPFQGPELGSPKHLKHLHSSRTFAVECLPSAPASQQQSCPALRAMPLINLPTVAYIGTLPLPWLWQSCGDNENRPSGRGPIQRILSELIAAAQGQCWTTWSVTILGSTMGSTLLWV